MSQRKAEVILVCSSSASFAIVALSTLFLPDLYSLEENSVENEMGKENSLQSDYLGSGR